MTTERIDIVVSQRGAKEVRRDIESIGTGAKTASTGVNFLKNALKFIGVGTVIRETARLSDSYTTITNRLRIATRSTSELTAVQHELFAISQRTRSEFATNAQLYNRLAIASKELAASQSQLLTFTEAVGNALAIAGGTVESTRGALIQLSQAVGTSIVRAEEFNSILEGAPRIAQAVAQGLDKAGGSVAKLRKFIVEGQVTSKEFFDALLSQAPKLAEEFSKVTITISQSFIKLNNALTLFTGESGTVSFAAGALAKSISVLADNIEVLGNVLVFTATIFAARFVASIAAKIRASAAAKIATLQLKAAVDAANASIIAYGRSLNALPFAMANATRMTQALAKQQLAAQGSTAAGTIFVNRFGVAAAGTATRVGTLAGGLLALGRGALSLVGGPLGLLLGGIFLLQLRTTDAEKAQDAHNKVMLESIRISGQLATKRGEELEKAKEARDEILRVAKANVEEARTALDAAEAITKQVNAHNALLVARTGQIPQGGTLGERAAIEEARNRLLEQQKRLEDLQDSFAGADGAGGGGTGTGTGTGKSKADILGEENLRLEQQIHLLGLSGQAREVESRIIDVQNQLRQQGFSLTDEEEQRLRARIATYLELNEQVRAQEELLQSIRGPQDNYNRSIAAANELLKQGKISTEEYNQTVRDLRIALLETSTTMEAGFERGILKVQKEFEDLATASERVVTNMAKNLEDTLVEFSRTGKLSFRSLIDSMIEDIIRLQARQALNTIFGGGGGSGGGFGGFLGSLGGLGSFLTGGFNNAGQAGLPWQTFGNVNPAGGLYLGNLGFATGTSFTVPGSGGVDSQQVAFRASPGERVTVDRPGEDRNMRGRGDTFVFNFPNSDAASFRRSQSQVAGEVARTIAKSRRNS